MDLTVFRQPIPVLVEREEIRFSLLDYREVVRRQKDTSVTFMIKYDTALKHDLSVSYVYDLSIYRNLTVVTPKS